MAVMTGNFDYWGIPQAEIPQVARGALALDEEATEKERRKAKLRPKRVRSGR